MIASAIQSIAINEVGVEEISGTNCGPRVNQYKSATELPPEKAWKWCAAFVDWCVLEAMKLGGPYTFQRPTTAGAWDLENWSLLQDKSTNTRRRPGIDITGGDIVIFNFHHVGIALSSPNGNGQFHTVEGNTDSAGSREGGGVFRKIRRLEQVKTRIRFTV